MRLLLAITVLATVMTACDTTRVYEEIVDFDQRQWLASDIEAFDFVIPDSKSHYNVYADIRNTVSYPYARLFYTFELKDSTGASLQRELNSEYLFDAKTGKPFGKSGIGDLYDHRFPLLSNHQFSYAGQYRITLEQFMRVDTLQGVLAVGIRVERAQNN
jgi:gliding motility-associated lipoprotein GldH